MATRFVSDQPLRVSPPVLGLPLASPMRRVLAVFLDGLVLLLPANLVVAGATALLLRVGDPAGYQALRVLLSDRFSEKASPEALHDARKQVARLLTRIEAPDLPPAVACAVGDGRLDAAAEGLAAIRLNLDLRLDEQESPHRTGYVNIPVPRLIPAPVRGIILLGVPALYFTFLTSLWGATLGKRLLGLRVVRLDAERLSLLESFERFTGYLHIPALLGWPILDLWRNPNRQLPHDRTVHTVVIRTSGKDGRAHAAAKAAPAQVEPRPAAETAGAPTDGATPAALAPESRPPSPPAAKE